MTKNNIALIAFSSLGWILFMWQAVDRYYAEKIESALYLDIQTEANLSNRLRHNVNLLEEKNTEMHYLYGQTYSDYKQCSEDTQELFAVYLVCEEQLQKDCGDLAKRHLDLQQKIAGLTSSFGRIHSHVDSLGKSIDRVSASTAKVSASVDKTSEIADSMSKTIDRMNNIYKD